MASSFICDDGRFAQFCVECGTTFEIRPDRKAGRLPITCSDECLKKRSLRRMSPAVCSHCDRPFFRRRLSKASVAAGLGRFCSQTCTKASTKIYPSLAAQKTAYEKRRRARLRTGIVERFSDLEIYERDRWRCGLCGGKVDKKLKAPDHMAASLDHIVPLSAGGAHVRSNVQCSHWICNSRKGDRAGGQMLLFG